MLTNKADLGQQPLQIIATIVAKMPRNDQKHAVLGTRGAGYGCLRACGKNSFVLAGHEMDPRFIPYIEHLHPKMQVLISMVPAKPRRLPPKMCDRGVYVLSEGEKHLYVGRSNKIKSRLSRHCRPGATHRMAAFAFRLAREETGNLKATYKKGVGSRAALIADTEFFKAFNTAKERISRMDVRFVEESDPTKQALLEIYVSVILETPYNDFDNH